MNKNRRQTNFFDRIGALISVYMENLAVGQF